MFGRFICHLLSEDFSKEGLTDVGDGCKIGTSTNEEMYMNVKELKEALAKYPDELEVEVWLSYDSESGQDWYADIEDLHINEENKLVFS